MPARVMTTARGADGGQGWAATRLALRQVLQRKCACGGNHEEECADCRKPRLQRRTLPGTDRSSRVPPIVYDVLRTPGTPLDPATRADMEGRFGRDFSRVRVHADETAARSARSVDAAAYTVGPDIVFGEGQYAPGTSRGRSLLAHELTHSLQQRGAAPQEHGRLTIAESSNACELKAEQAERAVTRGEGFRSKMHARATVARQPEPDAGAGDAQAGSPPDAGPVPDAGPTAAPAAPGAPGPAGPAAPAGPAPVAAPPVVRSVEVENQRTAITYPVRSNLGAAGRSHWVTIAGTRPDVVVRANLDPPITAADLAAAGLVWESDPPGQVAAGADTLHGTLSVPTARRTVVRATLGASSAETTIWAVFVAVTVAGGPAVAAPARRAGALAMNANANVRGRIHPASIITDADRPALDGPVTVDPPGGVNVCGEALAGGANLRWDMSRQIRIGHVDPAGLVPALTARFNALGLPGCVNNVTGYPAAPEVGNDDAGFVDENNDPYAGGGVITSLDSVRRAWFDSIGADGDAIEHHLHFREFARLEFNRTWWKVSQFAPWRVHFRVIRVGGRWQDNGSDAAPDNAGF